MATIDFATLDLIEHPIFVLQLGRDGLPRYAAFNEHARQRLDKRLDQIVGLTAAELYGGRLGAGAFEHHKAAFSTGTVRTYEILLPLSDSQRLIQTTLRPVMANDGSVFQVVGTSQDITINLPANEVRRELATATQEVEDFIRIAAHDLRTPMRNVTDIAEMLLDEFQDLGDGKVEMIRLLGKIGDNAMQLINDVMDYAQATNAVGKILEFDLADLVQEISVILDPRQQSEFLTEPAVVTCDRTAAQIAIRNIADNAIKYANPNTEAGSTKLQLRFDVEEIEGGFVGFRIRDNGKGFSNPALSFLAGGKLRSESGFGLLGVRRLIHARGGSIHVTNRANSPGAEVSFTLPGEIQNFGKPRTAAQ